MSIEFEDGLIEYAPEADEVYKNEDPNITRNLALERAMRLWPLATRQIPKVEVYVCRLCLRQYFLVEDLRGHMVQYHKYTLVTSTKPEEATKDDTQKINEEVKMQTDLEIVQQQTDFEIPPMPFKDFRLFLRAKMNLRCKITTNCKFLFENQAKLDMHTKCHLNGKNAKKFSCTICNMKALNWRRCSAHLWKEHQQDIDQLKCPICDFKAHASVLVWRHMRVHAKWRALVMRTLKREQAKKQQTKELQTSEKNVTEMKKEETVSNKNKYYAEKTCEICERKFVNGKTLSKHVKTVHHKLKPFICNVCGKKTSRKAGLEIHMRQHTGEKPLKCKECHFATRDPSVLHKHQLRHEISDKGKFHCNLCAYVCIQSTTYKRHLRTNHPEEYQKLKCDLCNFVTITVDKLKKHLDDHRRGLIMDAEDSLDATLTQKINQRKLLEKNDSVDCFLPLESIDSMPHDPVLDTGGVTIPAPTSEDTQFPLF